MYAFSSQGLLGVPSRVLGEILTGFLMFAGMLIASGATEFFLNFALALVGKTRGGPAKVAVLASGFFGSLSGSPMANVASTGAVTIPAMKKTGYPPHYAGAIEAVASSGGVIMPPVMGGLAFVFSAVTDTPYAQMVIAAFLPAILYYFGLIVQVDSYAVRVGLKGLKQEDVPNIWKTLKEGWPFLVVLAFLVFGLLYMRWGVKAPIFAAGLMFLLSFTSRKNMMTPRRFVGALVTIGGLISLITAIMMTVGFIVLGVQSTGAFISLTTELIGGGENLVTILLITVAVCYIFGMIGVAMPIYVVLAVTLIPNLVGSTDLNFIAVHLFVIYYINMQGITPPVCNVAFLGAAMSGARPMKTGFTAMRLGIVLIFLPFFFLFNPALILQGSGLDTIRFFFQCVVGIWILASGLEGYLLKVGMLSPWSRIMLVASGFLIAFPPWETTAIGVPLTVLVIAAYLVIKKTTAKVGRTTAVVK
jgi:TRAP transporter 4TM/12TM fusion protein